MTTWRTRIACWIPKATDTHSGCVMLTALVARTRLNITLYVLSLSFQLMPRDKPALIPFNAIKNAGSVTKPSSYTVNRYIIFSPTPSKSTRFNSPSPFWSQQALKQVPCYPTDVNCLTTNTTTNRLQCR